MDDPAKPSNRPATTTKVVPVSEKEAESKEDPEEKEHLENETLRLQQSYKEVAKAFITDYLNYNTQSLKDRREKLKSITTGKLLDQVAPEIDASGDGSELSSDPTFTSKVTQLNLFISDVKPELKTGDVLAEVTYEAKSTEGKTIVKSFVDLSIQTQEDGKMTVQEYHYYPQN